MVVRRRKGSMTFLFSDQIPQGSAEQEEDSGGKAWRRRGRRAMVAPVSAASLARGFSLNLVSRDRIVRIY